MSSVKVTLSRTVRACALAALLGSGIAGTPQSAQAINLTTQLYMPWVEGLARNVNVKATLCDELRQPVRPLREMFLRGNRKNDYWSGVFVGAPPDVRYVKFTWDDNSAIDRWVRPTPVFIQVNFNGPTNCDTEHWNPQP